MSGKIPLAPVDVSYTLNNTMQRRKVNSDEIPILKNGPKLLYNDEKTFNLVKRNRRVVDMSNVKSLSKMAKYDPQDVGLPK